MSLNYVERIDNEVKIKRVIISVSDKRGLDKLVPALIKINPEMTIYSTGGTFKAVREILAQDSPKSLIQLSEYTGQPEMQGGLVKSLDFKIYLGLLSEPYNRAHDKDLKRLNAVAFDMVVVNLYPFAKTIAAPGVRIEAAMALS
ncbi:Bifunctional purine biosynthesis protein PurH [subsurface metagenome]